MRRVSQRLLCLLALVPAVGLAADYYGAIAWSQRTKAHGWSRDYPTRTAAEKAALAGCAKLAKDCQVVLWFKNACGAIAIGPKGSGWAWNADQTLAEAGALNACAKHSKACTVKQRFCTAR